MLKNRSKTFLYLVSFFASVGVISQSPIFMVIPDWIDYFGGGGSIAKLLNNVLGLPSLAFAIFCVPFGILIDKHPKYKTYLITGCSLVAIGGSQLFFYSNLYLYLFFRFFCGIGICILVLTAYAISRSSFEEKLLNKFIILSSSLTYFIQFFAILLGYLFSKISIFAPCLVYSVFLVGIFFVLHTGIKDSSGFCEVKKFEKFKKKTLPQFVIGYFSIFIISLSFFIIFGNTPEMIKYIKKPDYFILIISFIDVFFSAIFAFKYDFIKKTKKKVNFLILMFLVGSLSFFAIGNLTKNIYIILILIAIFSSVKSLIIVHSVKWVVSLSSECNIGRVMSLFFVSMSAGMYSYTFIDSCSVGSLSGVMFKYTFLGSLMFLTLILLFLSKLFSKNIRNA